LGGYLVEGAGSGARGVNNKVLKEKIIKYLLLAGAFTSIGLVFLIIAEMIAIGYPQVIDWFTNGFGMKWIALAEEAGEYGIVPFIFSTLYVGAGAIAIATAVGLPTAIYLAEFANSKLRNIIKPSLEMLTGFPSIVIGLIGATLVVGFLTRYTGESAVGVAAGWIVLAIMAVPTIASVSEDAIRAVSPELKEASLGLGATQWQTTLKVLLPSAKSGIVAAIILALGGAIGEVMAVYYVMGLVMPPPITLNPFVNSSVLTSLLIKVTDNEYGESGAWWRAIFAAAFMLFLICAILNLLVRRILSKSKQKNKTMAYRLT
jgi:phosphate transport system permease protein